MCCLFGVLDYGHSLSNRTLTKMVSVLSRECEVRGTDATGISYINRNALSIYKRPLAARRMRFRIPCNCHVVMGHTRLTTQGSEKSNFNNHPFRGRAGNTYFALAHNGILHNDSRLQISEKLPPTNIKTDSYVAVQLLEKQKVLDFDSLKCMAEKVEGSFSFTILDQLGSLYFVKGDNPMCIYHFTGLGFYVYASTGEILNKAVERLGLQDYEHEPVPIAGGDILKIDSDGKGSRAYFEYEDMRLWGYRGNPLHTPLCSLYDGTFDDDYWEELRFMAHSFGYSPEDIDRCQRLGYPPDVVEEILYCGDGWVDEYAFDSYYGGLYNG